MLLSILARQFAQDGAVLHRVRAIALPAQLYELCAQQFKRLQLYINARDMVVNQVIDRAAARLTIDPKCDERANVSQAYLQ